MKKFNLVKTQYSERKFTQVENHQNNLSHSEVLIFGFLIQVENSVTVRQYKTEIIKIKNRRE